MKALLAALAFSVSTMALANDTINPRIEERSYVNRCDGDCWATPRSVPEPDVLWLLAIAGGAAWIVNRRRK